MRSKMKRFLFTILLLTAAAPLVAQLYHPGEELYYRVSYKAKMFPNTEMGTVEVRTSESGKLFGSVTADDVVAAVKKANGRSLDKHSIKLRKGDVKATGIYSVGVNLHKDITASLNFEVVGSAK